MSSTDSQLVTCTDCGKETPEKDSYQFMESRDLGYEVPSPWGGTVGGDRDGADGHPLPGMRAAENWAGRSAVKSARSRTVNRIERTPFNEYESLCQFSEQPDLEENMVQEVSLAGVAIAWGVCLFALLWLLTALLRAGLRFEHWKWMVAR